MLEPALNAFLPESDVRALGGAVSPMSSRPVRFDIRDVSDEVAQNLKHEFLSRQKAVDEHFAVTGLSKSFSGHISVQVFDGPPFSQALLFAWGGERGRMYFPAARARQRKAAIVHELAHVHAPNAVRFLAEGYSVYLEEKIGNLGAYPTNGNSIERELRNYCHAYETALASVNLDHFDGVATRWGVFLGDQIGLEAAFPKHDVGVVHRRAFSYLVSGSVVKFLIENHGLNSFKALYDLTPLTPRTATPADPRRYEGIFGQTLMALQSEWLGWLNSKKMSCV
jgi:hypothetical protein